MRLATIRLHEREMAAIVTEKGLLPLDKVNDQFNQNWPTHLFALLQTGQLEDLKAWLAAIDHEELLSAAGMVDHAQVQYAPLYRHPRKIWGIGLNYVEHASDLSEKAPSTEPASFMKPDTTIIGPGDTILVPHQSERTTAEAELGIIIGQTCKDVSEREAPDVIAGFTTILDMTAEDILQQNPRYLTRSKSFDTFLSFGPHLVTADEVPEVNDLHVATVINGKTHRRNVVANMTFDPWYLVSFHSHVMTLLPGDIICTGTPGAVPISEGDVVECHIDGFEILINPVKDLKAGE